MSHAEDHEGTRRDFLYYATAGAGAVTAGAAIWPLVNQMNPSADVQALASIRVDVSGVEPGTQLTVKWLGKPVFIRRRTENRDRRSARRGTEPASGSERAEPQRYDAGRVGPESHTGRGGRMAGHDRRLHAPGLRSHG